MVVLLLNYVFQLIACKTPNPREAQKDGGDIYLPWAIRMTVRCVLMLAVGLTINFYQMRKTNEFKTKLAKMTGLCTTFLRKEPSFF